MQLAAVFTSGVEQDTVQLAGADSLLVNSTKIDQTIPITYSLLQSAALGANPLALTIPLFLPDTNYSIVGGFFRPNVDGSGTVTLVHAVGSTPLGSSVNVLQSTFNLSGTVDVTQTALLVAGSSITNLAPGDAIGLRATTLGESSGEGVFTIILQRI